jgi:hypothetical protein
MLPVFAFSVAPGPFCRANARIATTSLVGIDKKSRSTLWQCLQAASYWWPARLREKAGALELTSRSAAKSTKNPD